MEICSEADCGRPVKVKSRGLCSRHSLRAQQAERGPCTIDDCPKRQMAAGLCSMHYCRKRNNGDPLVVQAVRGDDDHARQDKWVDRSGGAGACHPWIGSLDNGGYGLTTLDGRPAMAHRVAWILANGPIPDGFEIDHECHNAAKRAGRCPGGVCEHRRCCNPAHLAAKTRQDHSRDTEPWQHPKGDAHGKAKLTEDGVREIKRHLREGVLSGVAIAAQYGVTPSAVGDIKRGKSWAWLDVEDESAA
jgi:hypothetical protein